tara:strand:- start:199 stop:360 length:162 start_codon:yes stop_codon:yes gene_type:complete
LIDTAVIYSRKIQKDLEISFLKKFISKKVYLIELSKILKKEGPDILMEVLYSQ